jgi:hypothetical protein
MNSPEPSGTLLTHFVGHSPLQRDRDDPFAALDALLHVVEGLCPVWPTRPPDAHGSAYRL